LVCGLQTRRRNQNPQVNQRNRRQILRTLNTMIYANEGRRERAVKSSFRVRPLVDLAQPRARTRAVPKRNLCGSSAQKQPFAQLLHGRYWGVHRKKREAISNGGKNVYLVYAHLVYLVYTRLTACVLRSCDCPEKERLAKAVYLRYLGRST
jgi:hypothetical protein